MLFTTRTLPSSSIATVIVFSLVCIAVLSSHELCYTIQKSPSCDCSNTPDGYKLRCLAFSVEVKPKAVVHIQCDTNVVSWFFVLSGLHIGEVDKLIIQKCPLPLMSLSQLMQNMGVSNVSNVQLTYPRAYSNITTVKRELFHGLSNVTNITLHIDGTIKLADDVFTDMPNLMFIDLESNNIIFSKDVFCNVINLQVLQLGSNNLTYLETGIFNNLNHLRLLVLWGNITKLSKTVFSDIYNLQSLDIKSTKLNSLPSDLFANLTKLRKINLCANEFISLPQKLFINNPDLETVNLEDNRQTLNTLPSRLLGDLTKLKIVSIRNCNMSTLPEDLLWGSASINTILLNNNVFITIPATLFKDCTSLETVDLSYNRITDLPNRLFSTLKNLKSLNINNNQLSVIKSQLFVSLGNLVALDLKDNRLTHIETQAFEMLSSLKAVNLSNNLLTFKDAEEKGTTGLSPLKDCRMLENVQLENNSLIRIFPDWLKLMNLETLNLAYNKISEIPYGDLGFVSEKDIFVNVSYNNISEISEINIVGEYVNKDFGYVYLCWTALNLIFPTHKKHGNLPVRCIFVEGNFIKCDCNFPRFILQKIFPKNTYTEIIVESNPRNLQCSRREEYRENLINYLHLRALNCLLPKSHSLNCPEQCSCLLMISDKALLVDCSERNLKSMTTREDRLHNLSRAVFSDTHNLQLLEIDSIKMDSLPSDLLLDLTELKYINLYENEFLSLPQNLFVNNQNLIAVHIEDNRRTLNTLPPGLLGNRDSLHEVILRSCNTSTLPVDLLWGSQYIQYISLKNNAFTTLPELLFKDCWSLRLLDISYNRITDLPIRLFSSMGWLEILSINNNQLSIIPNNLFLPLWRLKVLDLKENRLTHIQSEAFINFKLLVRLDISNNHLVFTDTSTSRSRSPLKFCDMLEDLQLANNFLTKIFIDWREFRKLQILNLAYNKISQIKAEDLYFTGAENIFVNISYNNITEIDIFENKRVYKYISKTAVSRTLKLNNFPVRHIYIEGNPVSCDCKVYRFLQYNKNNGQDVTAGIKLTMKTNSDSHHCDKLEAYTGQVFQKIPIKHFTCLLKREHRKNCSEQCSCLAFPMTKTMVVQCHQTNLTSIPGRENGQHNLSREVFSDIHNLESLEIRGNRITDLSPDLFVDLINLRKISIYATRIQRLPQNMFVNNTNLEIINIENNGMMLKTLPSRFLAGLNKLKDTKLDSCNMMSLPEDLLWESTSINTVSLKNNALTTLPHQLFIHCIDLQTLDISFNRITDLPSDLFSDTRNLKTLKINNNQLSIIRNYLFYYLNKLEILDLKWNRLTNIEQNAFGNLTSLVTMDMSNNMLTFEEQSSFSFFECCHNLKDIQLANNYLTMMYYGWHYLENLQTLNLAYNKISYLQVQYFFSSSRKNTFVNISYNYISEINLFNYSYYSSNYDLYFHNFYNYVPTTKVYEPHVPIRYFFIEGNPINCDCKEYYLLQYVDDTIIAEVKLMIETDPSKLGCAHEDIEPTFPIKRDRKQQNKNIPIMYFNCLFKKGHSLDCPENCSCLFRTSDISLIVDCKEMNLTKMPRVLPDVKFLNYIELNLRGNIIESVKYPLGSSYHKVTKYILSDNMISEINLTAFSPKIQTLELDGNNITQFNKSSIDFLMNSTFLTKLSLHNNPWRCDCTTKNFVNVIQSIYNLRKINLLDHVICENGKEMLNISDAELCPVDSKIIVNESYILAAFGLLFGLLIGLLVALYYKFQNGIKIWLYAHRCCLWFVSEDELDQGKLYDAFVSYAYQDEEFVLDHLVPRLENEQYTLCLHQRDWIPGEFIPAQIARSVEVSRRTLIILSPAFMNSMWGTMEFRAAHAQALKEKRIRVIVILYGDIESTEKLDSELRAYITMNTYAKWGDKWFWEKLRYALPHSSKHRTGIELQEIT